MLNVIALYIDIAVQGSDHINNRTLRYCQSRYKWHEVKHWSSQNAGIVRELDDVVTQGEDRETGEKTFLSKKKFKPVKTVWEFADCVFNQIVATFLCRPYDYSMLVMWRCLHQARWFAQVESKEDKQLELCVEFYSKAQERNLNNARSKKPPADFETMWGLLRYTVQKAAGNPDKLMQGACYGAGNEDLAARFKAEKKTNDKLSKEVADCKQQVKKLEVELQQAKNNKPNRSGPKVKTESEAGGSGGNSSGKPFVSTSDKVKSCCMKFNRNEDCDKSCGLKHRCSWVERMDGGKSRVCWGAHSKKDHT